MNPTQMTPDEMRIVIAEATFFERIDDYGRPAWRDKRHPHSCVLHTFRSDGFPLPDYLNDLNAMHEAEKTLTDEQWNRYSYEVENVLERDVPENKRGNRDRHLLHATAAQRAEAFCKTLSL